MNSPEKPDNTEKLIKPPHKPHKPRKPKPFYQKTLTSGIFLLIFLVLFIYIENYDNYDDPPSFSVPDLIIGEPRKINFEEESHVSIQLIKNTIQASSLTEQIFPMLVSRKLPEIESPFRQPVDLICVIKLKYAEYYTIEDQIQDIQRSFRHLLPWMTDQDRLSIVLFGRPSYVDDLVNYFSASGSKIPPLTNMTRKNKMKILSSIGKNILNGDMSAWNGLEVAKEILSQRGETNQTTGIFMLIPVDGGRGYEYYMEGNHLKRQLDQAKVDLGLQDKGLIIRPFFCGFKGFGEPFAKSFATLRAGVVETQFLVRPEESQVFKDIKIKFVDFTIYHGWMQEDEAYIDKNANLEPGLQQDLAFYLKVPPILQPLPLSPIEVKVASCQLIFTLIDGSQVVKNADLVVKIVGEGEKFVEKEESLEVVKDFYYKWSEYWLFPTVWASANFNDYEKARELLKGYKENLDGSIVKDDEMLQNRVKEVEEGLDRREKSGVINCW